MSARAVVEVYRASSSRGTTRLVALTLADLAANDGEGIVQLEQLKAMTKLTEPPLRRALDELSSIGELCAPLGWVWPLGYELRVGELK